MNKKLVVATAAALLVATATYVGAAGPNKLETARASERIAAALPDYEIIASVRALGYVPITPAFRRGPFYVLHASDAYGTKLRVVADAQLGDIISIRQVFIPRYDAGPRIIHVPQRDEGAPPSGRK
jgi:hypothetical protein